MKDRGAIWERLHRGNRTLEGQLRRDKQRSSKKFKNYYKQYSVKRKLKTNPITIVAIHKINKAIAMGKIKRQPCEVCAHIGLRNTINIQAHHDDYKKMLEVRWFCPYHNAAWHRVFVSEY